MGDQPMLALLLAVVVFTALAVLVLRWAADDLAGPGTLSAKALVSSWLLYVFHADTVATAALTGAITVDVPSAPALAIGAGIALAGFVVFLAATITLVRHGDFAGPRTQRLVTVSAYRFSRHPQNLGWGVMLLGIAVAGRSLVALVLVGMFAAFVDRYSRLEEQQLQRHFGAAYEKYRARTPALLPRPGVLAALVATRRQTL